jgi:pyruvate formate lyase activating enzyme
MGEAKLYEKIKNNAVQCRLCNHLCVLKNNQLGLCGARQNKEGKLISLVYGYPVEMGVDPIEKKPLFHFFPGSQTYSVGTLGCNFVCANCQNWNISQAKQVAAKIEQMNYISPERIVEEALGNNCASISYTYNEPTIFAEYALDTMRLAQENGVKNVWVSNGYQTRELLEMILPYLDAINVDLKSVDKKFYQENCGAKLGPILENLRALKNEQVHLEITTLVIPGLTNDIDMLARLAEFISSELDMDTPWHVTKFSSSVSWKMKNLPSTGDDLIYEAYEIGKEAGLKYVYVGNIPGDQKENTYCPKCGEIAIRRFGYQVERLDNHGRCVHCDRDLDIVE